MVTDDPFIVRVGIRLTIGRSRLVLSVVDLHLRGKRILPPLFQFRD